MPGALRRLEIKNIYESGLASRLAPGVCGVDTREVVTSAASGSARAHFSKASSLRMRPIFAGLRKLATRSAAV